MKHPSPVSTGTATSALWRSRDQRSVWHPFTQHSLWAEDQPLVIDRAEGMYLYDADGNAYLDGFSSLWVTIHGHQVPEIDSAIRDQLSRLDHATFLGSTHAPGIELSEKLLATAPEGLSKVFYAGDGSSAVEAAIKMAFQAWAQRGQVRPLYVHVAEGYHGDTLGAVSVGGIDLFHQTYRPLMLDTRMIGSPGVLSPGQGRALRAEEVLSQLQAVLQADAAQVCAIIIEPMVQGAGGILTHDPAFVRGARDLADEFDTLLIADEVATGLGRTGRMWAVEHAGVAPDLLTCGKGLTGGYLPLSAVLASDRVYESFLGSADSARTFFHGHSYTANPLCCAAAIANLDLMQAHGTVAHADAIGLALGRLLEPLAEHAGVREIRRCGTMTGIELAAVPGLERTGFEVCRAARRRGVLIRPLGDVVVLMPPLAIEHADLNRLVDAVTDAVHEVCV